MPPTNGHLNLVRFANRLADGDDTIVIVTTQDGEPFVAERVEAVRRAVRDLPHVTVQQFHKTVPQDPASPGFRDMWRDLMHEFGFRAGDNFVASEPYGKWVAEQCGGNFWPYDLTRSITPTKATKARNDPAKNFDMVIPEFQKYLRTTVTIFGAESTGKTTLSRDIAKAMNTTWFCEYARPWLEQVRNEITRVSMTAIWKGQRALQQHADDLANIPILIQDTDLYSTVGYWEFPQWIPTIGECPEGLLEDAERLRSDLYIVTRSDIPFEQDPLRYGGDVREGSDEYWIDVCERYHLPYVILTTNDRDKRVHEAVCAIKKVQKRKLAQLAYDRHGF